MDQRVKSYCQKVASSGKWVVGAEWQSAEIQREVREAASSYATKLLALQARAKTDPAACRQMVRHLLTSASAQLCSLLMASKQRRKKMSWEELKTIAASLDPWKGTDEPVRVGLKPKKQGAFRSILKFGVRNTALQLLVVSAIQAQRALPDAEVCAYGKGRNSGIAHMMKVMNDQKLEWVTVFDVKDFFPSITPEGLPRLLGLPLSVITNCLFVTEGAPLQFEHHSLDEAAFAMVKLHIRQGLPQGSCSSPYVAGLVLATLMDAVPDTSRAITHVDDGMIASDKEGALAIKDALQLRASALPTGPVDLKRIETRRITNKRGIHFLGYLLIRGMDGNIRAVPQTSSFRKYEKATARALAGVPDKKLDEVARTRMMAFKAGQAAWDCTESSFEKLETAMWMLVSTERNRRININEGKSAPDSFPSAWSQLKAFQIQNLQLGPDAYS